MAEVYTYHAAEYCPDCGIDLPDTDPEGNPKHYSDDCDGSANATCDNCGAFVVTDAWGSHDWYQYPEDYPLTRWATCTGCNGQYAYTRDASDARLAALRGELNCPNCWKPTLHF